MAPLYTSEDVQQILERAMAYRQEFSHQQLEEMAAELEIPADLLRYFRAGVAGRTGS